MSYKKAGQANINASTTLTVGYNGIKIFFNPSFDINLTVDHLALTTNHENYFSNESIYPVTFVASSASSTLLVFYNGLVLNSGGTAYLIRKGTENKTFIYISNP